MRGLFGVQSLRPSKRFKHNAYMGCRNVAAMSVPRSLVSRTRPSDPPALASAPSCGWSLPRCLVTRRAQRSVTA